MIFIEIFPFAPNWPISLHYDIKLRLIDDDAIVARVFNVLLLFFGTGDRRSLGCAVFFNLFIVRKHQSIFVRF